MKRNRSPWSTSFFSLSRTLQSGFPNQKLGTYNCCGSSRKIKKHSLGTKSVVGFVGGQEERRRSCLEFSSPVTRHSSQHLSTMAEATPTSRSQQELIQEAAKVIQEADALLISTGAGFGVDSGLGTYRGRFSGVWAPLKALGIDYVDATDPSLFRTDPRLAWAYWASSFDQYTNKSTPHKGYTIIKRWARGKKHRLFSITSNIDGHWCRTVGENSVLEVHGSVTHMQRQDGKKCPVWKTEEGVRLIVGPR